jgi:hypothetical protein
MRLPRHKWLSIYRRVLEATLILVVVTVGFAHDAEAERKNGFDLDGSQVPARQILRGGPPRDGIPSLDNPSFISPRQASFLEATDRILGVVIDGTARAYPIRILNYHEIVNDRIGSTRFVVTYCPLCGSGVVFDATVAGRRLEFGVSGLLYNSDVLLYDRKTRSLWSQLKREAITGPMRGERLEMIPVTHTSWKDWQERYPDTRVLSTATGYSRNYRVNPYPGYSNSGHLYFPVSEEDNRYPRKTMIMGIEIDRQFKAYPFTELEKSPRRFKDSFMGQPLSIVFDEEHQTGRVLDGAGRELPTTTAFWFAWYAFHPDTEVYVAGQTNGGTE